MKWYVTVWMEDNIGNHQISYSGGYIFWTIARIVAWFKCQYLNIIFPDDASILWSIKLGQPKKIKHWMVKS